MKGKGNKGEFECNFKELACLSRTLTVTIHIEVQASWLPFSLVITSNLCTGRQLKAIP